MNFQHYYFLSGKNEIKIIEPLNPPNLRIPGRPSRDRENKNKPKPEREEIISIAKGNVAHVELKTADYPNVSLLSDFYIKAKFPLNLGEITSENHLIIPVCSLFFEFNAREA